ncbi:MAG TPA: ribose 5-phosphate isomerase B [Planctomycetota bacterium]|nr:ribose 5-phosphate isomerase B [Planctomycetota bacterium]
MKIAVGSDHAGYELKQRLAQALQRQGHDVLDLGTHGTQSVDYPDFAGAVAGAVAGGRAERGLLVCGTGIGMSIRANREPGVRAAKCNDPLEARMARAHNDANVLCLGARVLDPSVAEELLSLFLSTPFEGGRHATRVAKLGAV